MLQFLQEGFGIADQLDMHPVEAVEYRALKAEAGCRSPHPGPESDALYDAGNVNGRAFHHSNTGVSLLLSGIISSRSISNSLCAMGPGLPLPTGFLSNSMTGVMLGVVPYI